jgi:hypothetical protein
MKHHASLSRKLHRNNEGATIVEFALVFLPLFAIISGIIEFSLLYYANSVIENSATIGSRLGITGDDYSDEPRVISGADRVDMIRQNIVNQSRGLLNEEKISITCESLGKEFTGVPEGARGNHVCGGTIDNDSSCDTGGDGGDVVIYTVSYCWETLTPLGVYLPLMTGTPYNDNRNEVLLTSSLIVRNERF